MGYNAIVLSLNFVLKLQEELEKFFHQKEESAEIFCSSSLGLLEHMERQNNYSLYLLDIEMPEMDGMELAKKIFWDIMQLFCRFCRIVHKNNVLTTPVFSPAFHPPKALLWK